MAANSGTEHAPRTPASPVRRWRSAVGLVPICLCFLPSCVGLKVAGLEQERRLTELIDWAKVHGGTGLDNIRLTSFDKGGHMVRGVAAARNIDNGSTIFRIPDAIILSTSHPLYRASPVFNASILDQAIPENTRVVGFRFMLYIAIEMRKVLNGQHSFWEPYIRALPTPEEYASFHPAYAGQAIKMHFEKLLANSETRTLPYEKAWPTLGKHWKELASQAGAEGLTLEDIVWADTVRSTRTYGAGDAVGGRLVPIGDMTNAAVRAATTSDWGLNLSGTPPVWALTARTPMREGDEITDQYGDRSNLNYMAQYGFLLADNPRYQYNLTTSSCKHLLQSVRNGGLEAEAQEQHQLGTLQLLRQGVFEACGGAMCRHVKKTLASIRAGSRHLDHAGEDLLIQFDEHCRSVPTFASSSL